MIVEPLPDLILSRIIFRINSIIIIFGVFYSNYGFENLLPKIDLDG